MIVYSQYNERITIFEPNMNIFINGIFVTIASVLVSQGYTHNINFLMMFILSIIMCHLNDTVTKVYSIIPESNYNIVNVSCVLSKNTFLLWYVGSYFVMMNIIINYTWPSFISSCLVTAIYGAILVMYISTLACISYYHFKPNHC